jgi:hypothetical protein
MSRMNTGGPIVVKPSSNIYTALSGVAVLSCIAAVVALFMAYQKFGFDIFKVS